MEASWVADVHDVEGYKGRKELMRAFITISSVFNVLPTVPGIKHSDTIEATHTASKCRIDYMVQTSFFTPGLMYMHSFVWLEDYGIDPVPVIYHKSRAAAA